MNRPNLESFKVEEFNTATVEMMRYIEALELEISAVAEATGCMIVVREGGGPENIAATLALSVARLKHKHDAAIVMLKKVHSLHLLTNEEMADIILKDTKEV